MIEEKDLKKGTIGLIAAIVFGVLWCVECGITEKMTLLSPLFVAFTVSAIYSRYKFSQKNFFLYIGWVSFCVAVATYLIYF